MQEKGFTLAKAKYDSYCLERKGKFLDAYYSVKSHYEKHLATAGWHNRNEADFIAKLDGLRIPAARECIETAEKLAEENLVKGKRVGQDAEKYFREVLVLLEGASDRQSYSEKQKMIARAKNGLREIEGFDKAAKMIEEKKLLSAKIALEAMKKKVPLSFILLEPVLKNLEQCKRLKQEAEDALHDKQFALAKKKTGEIRSINDECDCDIKELEEMIEKTEIVEKMIRRAKHKAGEEDEASLRLALSFIQKALRIDSDNVFALSIKEVIKVKLDNLVNEKASDSEYLPKNLNGAMKNNEQTRACVYGTKEPEQTDDRDWPGESDTESLKRENNEFQAYMKAKELFKQGMFEKCISVLQPFSHEFSHPKSRRFLDDALDAFDSEGTARLKIGRLSYLIISSKEVLVGRNAGSYSENIVALCDPNVSRKHGAILRCSGMYFYKDRQKCWHGTMLNDLMIQDRAVELKDGDRLGFGPFKRQDSKDSNARVTSPLFFLRMRIFGSGRRNTLKISCALSTAPEFVEDTNTEYLIAGGDITIGRDERNAIKICHPSVEPFHACLFRKNGRFYARDLDTQGGTSINGETLEGEMPLRLGDKIRFGRIETTLGQR